ncbi:hypothetical protein [Cellulomonas sp. URHB0016]
MTQRPTADESDQLGRALAGIAPPGWESMTLVYEEVGDEATHGVTASTATGPARATDRFDRDARRLLSELRARMYRPGAGTWYTATVVAHATGGTTVDFDHDHEPQSRFAPDSWAVDAGRFPRAPEATPAWLTQKTVRPEWGGARWQVDLTADGVPVDDSAPIDATTTPEARARLVRVAARLGELGVGVRERQDEGEDADGNAVLYDQLVVDVGEGHMAVCFWRSIVFWSVEVRPEHVDGDRFRQVARAVLAAVEATGFRASTPFDADGARLLGLAPA